VAAIEAPRHGSVDPPPLNLGALRRVKNVGPAGSRDLFRYVAFHDTPRTISAAASVMTAIGRLPGGAAHSENPSQTKPPLFYYGYTFRRGSPLLAFLFADDEIYLARTGDVIRGRYRIVGLGVRSLTIEDTLSGEREMVPLLGPFDR